MSRTKFWSDSTQQRKSTFQKVALLISGHPLSQKGDHNDQRRAINFNNRWTQTLKSGYCVPKKGDTSFMCYNSKNFALYIVSKKLAVWEEVMELKSIYESHTPYHWKQFCYFEIVPINVEAFARTFSIIMRHIEGFSLELMNQSQRKECLITALNIPTMQTSSTFNLIELSTICLSARWRLLILANSSVRA